MIRIMRVAELIEKYFPANDILHRIPNYKFSNHYILKDNLMGLISTPNVNNYRTGYSHIDDHTREDILAMNIDKSMFVQNEEKNIASYILDSINTLPQYTNHHNN
jgi:hypothetical protein